MYSPVMYNNYFIMVRVWPPFEQFQRKLVVTKMVIVLKRIILPRKLRVLQRYHLSRDVGLAKNHYEHSFLKKVPVTQILGPGLWPVELIIGYPPSEDLSSY